jgi:hypothetical protein
MQRSMLIQLLLPVIITAALLFVRKRFHFRIYAIAAAATVAISLVLWRSFPDAMFYYQGSLNAGGVDSFAFVPAFTSIAFVCAIPAVPVWRFFQPFVAVLRAFYCLSRYVWIA